MAADAIEVYGNLSGRPIDVIFNYDMNGQAGWTSIPTEDPNQQPTTLRTLSQWTAPEIVLLQSGRVVQLITNNWVPTNHDGSPVTTNAQMKTVLDEKYLAELDRLVAENRRDHEDNAISFRDSGGTWGQE